MIRQLLLLFGSIWLGKISIHSARQFIKSKGGRREDRISALPEDLLINILMFVSTKDVMATMILSKRWRFVWTMVPQLLYQDCHGKKKSVWWLLDKSLQLHKAPVLENLIIVLGRRCPIDADVGKWIAYAVDHRVRHLTFKLDWLSEPTRFLPKSLYTCDTLVLLTLGLKIFLDVPSTVYLPSLKSLCLWDVVYKDDDSLVRILSGCPILKYLVVQRHYRDNLTNIIVKVPYLKSLAYVYKGSVKADAASMKGSMVIDCATLRNFFLGDHTKGDSYYSFENKPPLNMASIHTVNCSFDDRFKTSLSSVMHLNLLLITDTVEFCYAINFSQLVECRIQPVQLDSLEPIMCFLHNSPKLKILHIDQVNQIEDILSFNPPSSVPECLSTHIELFDWKGYRGKQGEKEFLRYILANSKCLKTAGISIDPNYNQKKMMKELQVMSRVSTSSQLLFSTQAKLDFVASPFNKFVM